MTAEKSSGPFFLGLDGGSTNTKAVLFDSRGTMVARASVLTPRQTPAPGRMERDLADYWAITARTVQKLVLSSGIRPDQIKGVAVAAHGDGICLVDDEGTPVAPAILSSDTRAESILDRWREDGTVDAVHTESGVAPFAGSPATLIAWLVEHEPSTLDRSRWILSAKDWLRFALTGTIGTDRTDASASFMSATRQHYSTAVESRYSLHGILDRLPPASVSTDRAGTITATAARETGLAEGTPVAIGLHDVVGSMLGTAGLSREGLSVIAGTFGVNVGFSDEPVVHTGLNTRLGPLLDTWTVRRTSTASVANLDWALARLSPGSGESPTGIEAAVNAALDSEAANDPYYLPFLFGGREGQPGSASFLGLRSWHTETDMLRAVAEGITFNHRLDIERLSGVVDFDRIYLAGGAANNRRWAQMFSDVLHLPVHIAVEPEAGARGAAMCAAVASGSAGTLAAASHRMLPQTVSFRPRPDAVKRADRRYANYIRLVENLSASSFLSED